MFKSYLWVSENLEKSEYLYSTNHIALGCKPLVFFFLLKLCIYVCVSLSVGLCKWIPCPLRPEKEFGFCGAGETGSSTWYGFWGANWAPVGAVWALNPWSISSASWVFNFNTDAQNLCSWWLVTWNSRKQFTNSAQKHNVSHQVTTMYSQVTVPYGLVYSCTAGANSFPVPKEGSSWGPWLCFSQCWP